MTRAVVVGALSALVGCSGSQGDAGAVGANGDAGATTLTKVTPEAAGAHCANGGVKLEVGVDANANGTLDASEVNAAETTYVCDGKGTSSLVSTSVEPPGTHCPDGGTKIESGLDANGNGTLDPSEVNASSTAYVCKSQGRNALVTTSPEPYGAHCPFGGTKIETGLDANGDGTLEPSEVDAQATSYVCAVAPSGSLSPSTGVNVTIAPGAVSTDATKPVSVRFTLRDDRGFPVDVAGRYSVNAPMQPRFALAYFTKDAAGNVSPLTVYTKSGASPMPTAYDPASPGQGTLVENGSGAGDYTYTFPSATTPNGAVAVAYDASKLGESHVVWVQVSRQTDEVFPTNANTYYAANQDFYFVPDGSSAPVTRHVANQAGCDGCHAKFKPETTTANAFHGGGRVNVGFCNVCHNPGRTSNPAAMSSVFVHRIHFGEHISPANQFHGIVATYPQDVRNCAQCHAGAEQGAQAYTHPTRTACGSCHDNVAFDASAAGTCTVPPAVDANGLHAPCNHIGGAQADDSSCAASVCHTPDKLQNQQHRPVERPDPGNLWAGGTNANTNASYLAATGYAPPGATIVTYDVKSVEAVADASIAPAKRPRITFKLKLDGVDAVFQTYAAGSVTELLPNFVGSPSVYFAFAVPQDGIDAPADFNASASGYLRSIWNGTATGAGAGTLTGPDAAGYYTVTLTGVRIPANATMLTGGLGYTYSLASAPPLVQTNVPGYPLSNDGKNQGGLSVPAPNVWKVATGYTGRRTIVDTAKCKSCHGALGVAPTFHAGQRNDAPTCSFCHTPNRTSSGWAAGSKYFIHGIHAGRARQVDYTWHATQAGPGYDEVGFPGTLNKCTTCHVDFSFDFTNAINAAAIANMLPTTVATGKFDGSSATNPNNYYTLSPYVVADGITDYGTGFSFSAATGVSTEAAGTTLVISPLTTACSACHDSETALAHMRSNGGQFYVPRSVALAGDAPKEQCLICHGPGRVAAIGAVHQH